MGSTTNWEVVATIAEIVGAAGVIASLVCPALQLHQSTRVFRAVMNKNPNLALRFTNMEIASNDALAMLSTEIRQFDDEQWVGCWRRGSWLRQM